MVGRSVCMPAARARVGNKKNRRCLDQDDYGVDHELVGLRVVQQAGAGLQALEARAHIRSILGKIH